ncbi:MAG: hypothetical protein MSC31_03525 [Solirubrobacteraceae bacterium MAG38_C4-C5]|nr:hypothetical protein [Candidatus Siliceabacter maunaloa]
MPPTVGGRDERLLAPRWVHHADVAKVCGWVTRIASLPGGHATAPRGTGGDRVWPLFTIPSGPGQRASAVPLFVQDLAQSFVDLYLARQAADYDHLDRFDKSRAIALVDDAKQALDLLSNNRGDAYLERMLSLVVLRASRAS